MFKSFQEYIDQNKKVVEKPKVAKVADFEGKQPTKPEKEKKSKDAGGAEQVGDVKPYSNGENAKDPNKEDKSGLVYQGDKKLVYEPNVDEKSKETKTWPKTDVSEWIDKTKNLSLAEFTKKVREESGDCSEGIYETVRAIIEACKCSKKNVGTFVRESKRNKILESLMEEIFKLPESYQVLSALIENKFYSSKFDKMFNEMVAEPVGLDGEEGHEDSEDEEDIEGLDIDSEEGDHDEDSEGEDDEMGDMEDEEGEDDEMGDMEDEMSDMEDEEGEDDEMGDMEDEMGGEAGSQGPVNPFMPREATWHYKGINDAPESAKNKMLDLRTSGETEGGPSPALQSYSELENELKEAKRKVRDIERRMIRFIQMRGVPTA